MPPSTMENEMFRSILACLPPPPPVSITASRFDGAVFSSSSTSSGRDRISHLPQDIQRTVVSNLPVKEGARTTTLSSRWRGIWASIPLVLDDSQLLPAGGGSDAVVKTVSRVLASHPGPFRSVRLTCSNMNPHRRALKVWIQDFVAKGIGDLLILNRRWPADLTLPGEILRCSSLERLYLVLCHLPDITKPRKVDFPKLRELVLCHAFLPAADLGPLLAGSPALEVLAFVKSYGVPKYINIRSPKLKCLLLWMFKPAELSLLDMPCLERLILWETNPFCFPPPTRIKISSTPNLRAVGYLNPGLHVLQIGETIINAGTKASPAVVIPSVETLAMKIKFGVEEEERMVLSFLRLFPNIKTLYVKSAVPPICLQSELDLKFWKKNIGSIECVQSQLRKLAFYEFQGEVGSELSFIKSIAETASFLKEMLILLADDIVDSPDEMKTRLLNNLSAAKWASDATKWGISPGNRSEWNYKTASDLSRDPFDYMS